MADEFVLTRTDRPFSSGDHAEIARHLLTQPHLIHEGVHYLFASEQDKEARKGRVTNVGDVNRVLVTNVEFRGDEVILIPVGDEADRSLKRLVEWCQSRWPCALSYYGDPKTPDDLVDEDALA